MLEIDANRLLADLADLGEIGRTSEGGVSRPALSPADLAARDWFRQQVSEAGLEFRSDAAGNVSAVLPASTNTAATLLTGSHLDTVPNGGRFDGALGVLAGLEVLRTIQEAGLELPIHLEAISFTDEEGALVSLLGSRALSGQLDLEALEHPRGGQEALEAGCSRAGLRATSLAEASRPPGSVHGFVELHIEQGTRLEEGGARIGIVTSIVGIRSFWLHFGGEAAHAGTTPLARRADALWGATEFVQRAQRLVEGRFAPGVFNCGRLAVEPGAFNIVPAKVRLSLELRHGSVDELDEMERELLALGATVAQNSSLRFESVRADRTDPMPMDGEVQTAIASASDRLGHAHRRMVSFAGHDAGPLGIIAPTGMIFVPSVGGVSHHPQERTRPEDVAAGANVLLHTLLELANGPSSN